MAKREIVVCDKCGSAIATAPSLDEMVAAMPPMFKPLMMMVNMSDMREALTTKLFRCAPCTLEHES